MHDVDMFQDSVQKEKEESLGIGNDIVEGIAEYCMHIIVCNCRIQTIFRTVFLRISVLGREIDSTV